MVKTKKKHAALYERKLKADKPLIKVINTAANRITHIVYTTEKKQDGSIGSPPKLRRRLASLKAAQDYLSFKMSGKLHGASTMNNGTLKQVVNKHTTVYWKITEVAKEGELNLDMTELEK